MTVLDKNALKQVSSPLKAGLTYFVAVFICAFLMGIVRVTVAIPVIGATRAVLIEVPLILAISWVVSRRLVARFGVAAQITPRLIMGGLGFGLTMIAEIGLSTVVFGQTVSQYLESFGSVAAVLGLLGQLAFALVPAVQLAARR